MKFQILQERLSKALSITSKFVSYRAQLPVLSNICFKADKGKLILSATNLEMSISQSIGAKIETEGEITIPAKIIVDLANSLSGEVVDFEVDREQIIISSDNFKSTILGMNASDFPVIPQSIDDSSLKIPAALFVESVSKVIFAASTDETRPVLTGVLFSFDNSILTIAATDGFRLSKKMIKVETDLKDSFILPKNILSELIKLASTENEVSLFFDKKQSQAVFGVGECVLSSRIIDGTFPDFEKIIPKNPEYKVNVDKSEFHKAIKLASIFARDSANVIKCALLDKNIEITAESAQSGSQKNIVSARVDNLGTKILEEGLIAVNFKFVEDFLTHIDSTDLDIEITNGSTAAVFRDTKDKDFLHLIMPVRM